MIKKETYKRILTSLVLLPIIIFSIFSDSLFFNIILLATFFFASYEWYNISKKSFTYLFIGFLIIIIAIFSAYFLRGSDNTSHQLFLWLLLIVIFSDTGGYISGKIIGGKKLTKISPNKTISGMIGSYAFAILPIFVIYVLNDLKIVIFEQLTLSIKTLILSLIFSLISQFGDLTVSYFKRKKKVKDTGNVLPGHGGLLDRIDGLIFLLIFAAIFKFAKII